MRPSFQKSLARTGFEEVSSATDRLHEDGVLRVCFDFFAQAADVHIDAARSDEALGAPDRIEQLIASENAIGAGGEKIEQAKFEGAHGYGLTGARDAVSGGVNAESANFDGFFGGSARFGAAEQSFHARDEF